MKAKVLVVAGLDPSGGAGLLADADAIRAGGGQPLLCAAAITAQSHSAASQAFPLEPAWVRAQVLTLLEEEAGIGAIKLGMLGSAAIAAALAELRNHPAAAQIPWVVDPVLRASSGTPLLEGDAREAYLPLLTASTLLTPNLSEAGLLAGSQVPASTEEMEACAEQLLASGLGGLLLTGGHLEGQPSDLLAAEGELCWLEGRRIPGTKRGTGCRLASFLAARLAQGLPAAAAAREAKAYVASYLAGT